ncbi:MAG: hypothetical protein KDD04_07920, partial [Sinomicrobium sp.]|nr:hypothetical protein [Sinomicrobium sp.]
QNPDSFKGRSLEKVDMAGSEIASLLSRIEGAITGVTVTHDNGEEIKLDIDYNGLKNAYITIAVENKAKKDLYYVEKAAFSLKGKTSPAEVILKLNESAPKHTAVESAYLDIKVTSPGTFPKQFLYKLDKKWVRKKDPGKIIVPVVLEPVGAAGYLNENEVLVKPEIKPQLKTTQVKPAASVRVPFRPQTKPQLSPQNAGPQSMIAKVAVKTTSMPKGMDGTWLNTDPNTTGITKVVISGNEKYIQFYEKCDAGDCDRGKQPLYPKKDPKTYEATFSTPGVTYYLTIDNNKGLKIIREIVYKKAGGRATRTEDTFEKQSATQQPAVAVSTPQPIDGIWINTDQSSMGITRIAVSSNGKQITMYEKCVPEDCNRGTRELRLENPPGIYTAVFQGKTATSHLILNFNETLKIAHRKTYTGGSEKVTSEGPFVKQTLQEAVADVAETNEPQGPDNTPVSLWEGLVADTNFEFPYEITNIRMDIYPDKNPRSGVFY